MEQKLHTRQKPMIELRPARLSDIRILFDWRNDPITRENFVNGEPVKWQEHLCWFENALESRHCKILIAEDGQTPVGTIRIDSHDDGVAFLSWNVSPKHRGCRYGTEMLRQVCQLEPNKTLVAKIKPTNIASVHMAMSCGFWCNVEEDGLLIWTRLPIKL